MRECVLENVDADTFACFAQYAYAGQYCLTKLEKRTTSVTKFDEPYYGLSDFSCRSGIDCINKNKNGNRMTKKVTEGDFPYCSAECRAAIKDQYLHRAVCIVCHQSSPSKNEFELAAVICAKCRRATMVAAPTQPSTVNTQLGRDFLQLKLRLRSPLRSTHLIDEAPVTSPALIMHAKLNAPADMWGIEELVRQTVEGMYKDLCVFKPTAENIEELVDMIEYVWENSTEEDSSADKMDMRSMLLAYIQNQAEELYKFSEFKDMVNSNPEVAGSAFGSMLASKKRKRN